ncbi:hypothetical protein HPB48_010467 [Haemaphysalis longicornis]|uniref:Uncharacterized protein n=1 Tax=Haemaphysalis longicornis TaxID=44386 RepID=A0A9J6FQQ1_HAELO|nr:hypothetical protein HPB48_010467 [Haemaphysalis longicornis]
MLFPEAVPTQFPSLPKYLSKQLPPNRKRPEEAHPQPHPASSAPGMVTHPRVESVELSRSFSIKNLAVPSAAWGKHTLRVSPLYLWLAACVARRTISMYCSLASQLCFLWDASHEVFVEGMRQHDVACDDPALLLGRVDAMSISLGASTVPEVSFAIGSNKLHLTDMATSSRKCQLVSPEGKPCAA